LDPFARKDHIATFRLSKRLCLATRRPAAILALAVVYAVFGLLSFPSELSNGIVTPTCFFPEGLSLAAGLALGGWLWPGVFLGQLWLALHRLVPLPAALAIALGNSLELVLACALFRRLRLRADLLRLKDLLVLLLLIFAVLQPFSASIGTLALAQAGALAPGTTLVATWQNWWIGNGISQALLAPLLLSAGQQPRHLGRHLARVGLALLLVVPLARLAFQLIHPNSTSVLLVLFTPLLVLIALGLGLPGASAGGLGLAVTALAMTRLGLGPFVVDGVIHVVDLNVFVLGLGMTAQLLAVLLAERSRLEAQLRHLAYLDALTQLPNRRWLQERLRSLAADPTAADQFHALIFLDLDRFKPINDRHGHEGGDRVLIVLAERLRQSVRSHDLVCRFGGDEFVVLLERLAEDHAQAQQAAAVMAEAIGERLRGPVSLDSGEISCSASHGITLFLGRELQHRQILNEADKAMYASKQQSEDGG
jgi:diguanylate cyclase (GGDEF)-like protein